MSDTLQQYTNYSGETFEQPEEMICILPPNNIRIKISGIDGTDCRETFERRRAEFRRLEGDIDMCTPRLTKYYSENR